MRIQAGHHRQTFFNARLARLNIGFHFDRTQIDERNRPLRQQCDRFQCSMPHDRHHDVQLKLAPCRTAERHRLIIPNHTCRNLHQTFAHDWIHFSRHDRATRLTVWQHHLIKSTARSRPQPANVVGDIKQGGGNRPQMTMTIDQPITLGIGFKMIDCLDKRNPRFLGQCRTGVASKIGMGINPCTHSGPPHWQFEHRLQRLFGATDAQLQLTGKTPKFLSQSQRCRVRQMRPANLDDLVPVACFLGQHLFKPLQCGNQSFMNRTSDRHVNRGGKGIIRTLSHVDMVIGMNRLFEFKPIATRDFNRPIGNHLVDIHVARSARSRLEHIHGKLGIKFPFDHLFRRGQHRVDLNGG